jgi:hypothetical protein
MSIFAKPSPYLFARMQLSPRIMDHLLDEIAAKVVDRIKQQIYSEIFRVTPAVFIVPTNCGKAQRETH